MIKKSKLKHYNRVLEFDFIIMQPDGKTATGRYRYKCMKCGAKRNTSDKSKTFKSCVKCGVDCQHFYWENRIKALAEDELRHAASRGVTLKMKITFE